MRGYRTDVAVFFPEGRGNGCGAYERGSFLSGLCAFAGFVSGDALCDRERAWRMHWIDRADLPLDEPLDGEEMAALFSRVTDVPANDPALAACGTGPMDPAEAYRRLCAVLDTLPQRSFSAPGATYRVFPMEHDISGAPQDLPLAMNGGAGGAVINAVWRDGWNGNAQLLDDLYDTARRLQADGLHAWLYDEQVYPSGWAGGYIEEDGRDRKAKNIGLLRVTGTGSRSVDEGLPERGIRFVYAAFYRGGDYAAPLPLTVTDGRVTGTSPAGEWELLAFYIRPCNIWPYAFATTIDPPIGPREHLNFLEREGVARFIEGALSRVQAHDPAFADLFDAVFTDEPSLQAVYIYGDAGKPSFRSVPYGSELFSRYLSMHGEELPPLLPYLFFGDDERARGVRIAYWRTVAELMSDNFTGQYAAWCRAHRVCLSGHYHSEENLYFHVGNYGDLMQVMSRADIPGFDMLIATHARFWQKGEGVNKGAMFLAGKLASSVSRQKGGNTTMVEVCPVAHADEQHDEFLDNFLGLTTDCAFIGATRFNNYGYHFITDPAKLETLNAYTGRLCAMLRGAVSDARVAVYYPIADAQAAFFAPDAAMDALSTEELAQNDYFENLQYSLLVHHLDYNIVDERGVLDGTLTPDGLRIGTTAYRAVVMPRTRVLPLPVAQKLAAFAAAGGAVLWLDAVPDMGVGRAQHEAVRRLCGTFGEYHVFRPDDLARGAAAFADSTDRMNGYDPAFVTNGSIETDFAWEGWCSERVPAELTLELPRPTTFDRLDLYSKRDYEQTAFAAFARCGGQWQPLCEVADNADDHVHRTFPPVTADAVRLTFPAGCRQQPDNARVTEAALYLVRRPSDPVIARLHEIGGETLQITAADGEAADETDVFVSRYRRGGRTCYFLIVPGTRARTVTLTAPEHARMRLYRPEDGTVTDTGSTVTLTVGAGRGVFWETADTPGGEPC